MGEEQRADVGDRELQRWARHVGVGQIADALDRVRALASD